MEIATCSRILARFEWGTERGLMGQARITALWKRGGLGGKSWSEIGGIPLTSGRPKAWFRKGTAYILHEFLADGTNVLWERGGEHHHLLLVRSQAEDVLHVSTHVWKDRDEHGYEFIEQISETNRGVWIWTVFFRFYSKSIKLFSLITPLTRTYFQFSVHVIAHSLFLFSLNIFKLFLSFPFLN